MVYQGKHFDSLESFWNWLEENEPDHARLVDYRARRLDVAADLGKAERPPQAISGGRVIA